MVLPETFFDKFVSGDRRGTGTYLGGKDRLLTTEQQRLGKLMGGHVNQGPGPSFKRTRSECPSGKCPSLRDCKLRIVDLSNP